MKLFVKAICISALLCMFASGVTSINWDGVEDTENAYPAVGATFYNRTKREAFNDFEFFPDGYDYDRYGLGCTVFLVAPKIAMSAGHCFDERIEEKYFDKDGYPVPTENGDEEFWISFESSVLMDECSPTPDNLPNRYDCRSATDLEQTLGLLHIERIVMHPKYSVKGFFEYDFAAVILKDPVFNIDSLPVVREVDYLTEANLNPQRSVFTTVGYGGFFSEESDKKWDLQFDDIRRFTTGHYRGLTKRWLRINKNNKVDGDGGACFGDSGGPVFYSGDTASEQIVVAVTHLTTDVNCISQDQAARIDREEFQVWLDELFEEYGSPE